MEWSADKIMFLTWQYSACDIVLLGQIFYYRWKNAKRHDDSNQGPRTDDERTPLVAGAQENRPTPNDVVVPFRVLVVRYTLAVLFVIVVGVGAWWVNEGRFNTPNLHGFSETLKEKTRPKHYILVQFFGWSSAVLFVRTFCLFPPKGWY